MKGSTSSGEGGLTTPAGGGSRRWEGGESGAVDGSVDGVGSPGAHAEGGDSDRHGEAQRQRWFQSSQKAPGVGIRRHLSLWKRTEKGVTGRLTTNTLTQYEQILDRNNCPCSHSPSMIKVSYSPHTGFWALI